MSRIKHSHFATWTVTLTILVLGSDASGAKLHLTAGRHTYPFTYQLPQDIPSSFEGKYGYVRYFAKGIIDKPWKFDHETMKCFTVICPLDLNQESLATVSDEVILVGVPFINHLLYAVENISLMWTADRYANEFWHKSCNICKTFIPTSTSTIYHNIYILKPKGNWMHSFTR